MIAGTISIDAFSYGFYDGQVHAPERDGPAPVHAKILRVDTGDGVIIEIPFRAEHWPTFQEKVAEAGPVKVIQVAPAGALRGIPSMDEIIANGRG